ncbi:MAG: tetrathionate reductase family octaheme c-type cytochrome [Thermodesulfobacteriota bacterium]
MKKYHVFSALLAASTFAIGATSAGAGDAHKGITGPFATPMDVTKKCLECHADAAEIMKTSHWTWSMKQDVGKGMVERGKKNVINNFCIGVSSNWTRCTSCHIGYGWKDDKFDFNDKNRVDCLVCHDTTSTYKKPAPAAGMPAGFTGNPELDQKPVDLVKVAQNAGKPGRVNCVVCHGYGGGGDNVKHGDIDSTSAKTTAAVDVHMGTDGLNFSCQECHKTVKHNIKGNAMVVSPTAGNHIECTDCHDAAPHKNATLNKHTASVACQTCHIPVYAKGMPTKLSWDWSTAGQDITPPKDEFGKETYDKKKGHFTWGKNVVPTYLWYNGKGGAYQAGDKIDPAKVTKLNWPQGDIKDKKAKIYPFKEHTGKQVYDKKNMHFLVPKVWPTGKDDKDAYWKNFNWDAALKAGAQASGIAYSGEYAFAPTTMYWRLNHMVSPKAESLKCNDCHSAKGRLDWKALGYKGDPMKVKGAARMGKKK